jgi:transcriptional regulator with XRE-family HTH domain
MSAPSNAELLKNYVTTHGLAVTAAQVGLTRQQLSRLVSGACSKPHGATRQRLAMLGIPPENWDSRVTTTDTPDDPARQALTTAIRAHGLPEIARRLNLSPSVIAAYANGSRHPGPKAIEAMKTLGITDWLPPTTDPLSSLKPIPRAIVACLMAMYPVAQKQMQADIEAAIHSLVPRRMIPASYAEVIINQMRMMAEAEQKLDTL